MTAQCSNRYAIGQIKDVSGGETTYYVWEGSQMIAEINRSGTTSHV